MKSDGEVRIKIIVDDGNSSKIIKDLDGTLKGLQGSGDQAGESMGKMGNQTDNAGGSAKRATKTFKDSTTALVAARVATLALETAKGSMDRAFGRLDTMENFERTLLRIYDGNQKTVDQILASTNDIVTGTAYALDTAANHVQGFIVSGKRQWEQAASDVGIWGDAVAFYGDGSSEQFDRVLRDLVSMSSKGSVRMGDLTNAVEAGIPVYDIYAAATGQTVEEVQKSFTAGQVSAEEFLDVMNTSFSQGVDGFVAIEGAAKEAGGSWTNTFSNFATATARGTASIISDLDDAFGETRWGSIRDNISRSGKLFESVLKSVGQVAASTVIFVDKYAEAILGVSAAYATWVVISKYQKAIEATSFTMQMVNKATTLVTISTQGLTLVTKKQIAAQMASTGATYADTVAQFANQGALTAKGLILGVLSKQIPITMAAQTAWTAVTVKATAIQLKLNAAIFANPLFWKAAIVAAGVGLVTTIIGKYAKKNRETTKEVKDLNTAQEELRESVEGLSDTTRDSSVAFSENKKDIEVNRRANMELANQIQALTEVEGNSTANKALLDSKIQELNHSVEGLNLSYDEESGLLSDSIELIQERIQAQADQEKMNVAQERLTEILREQMETEMKLEEVNAKREIWNEKLRDGTINTKQHKKAMEDLDEQSEILVVTQEDLAISYEAAARVQQESAEAVAQAVEDGTLRQITSWEELESNHSEAAERMKETYKMFADVATTSDKKVFDSQDLLVQKTDENGKAIEGSYYSLEESIKQSIDNVLEIKEHNIRVAEEWGTNLGIISENACDSVVDEMMRMAQESPEMAYLMVNSSEEQFARFEEVARGRSEAASNSMNNQLGEGYEDVIQLTSDMMGVELPETLIRLLNDAGFGDAGAQIPDDIADGVEENQEAPKTSVGKLLSGTTDYLKQRFGSGEYKDVGAMMPDELGSGIEKGKPSVFNATKSMVKSADDEAKELEPKFNSAGVDAILGLANGMSDNENVAATAANGVADSVFRSLKSGFLIHSPSRLMRDQIGKPIVEGIAVGIDKNAKLIDRSLNNLNKDMLQSTKKGSKEVVKGYDDMGRDLERSLKRWPSFTRSALTAVNQVFQTQTRISNRTITQAVAEMTRSMNQLTPNFRSAGQSAMSGLNQGLLNGRGQVMNTARSIANQVASTMQDALKINSPSRIMRDEVGKWIPYGIAEGIDSHADKALNSADDLGKQMIKLPTITAESILEGRFGRLGSPQTNSTSSTANDYSVTNHYSYEGLMEGATIVWNNKEDIRQTMQEIAWITQREEARM